jgi:hypothetical protein
MTAITYSPDPAVAGQPVTICIDVAGLTLPLTLRVYFDVNLGTHDEVISAEDIDPSSDTTVICFQVGIPSGCSGALVVDRSGQVSDCAITVAP